MLKILKIIKHFLGYFFPPKLKDIINFIIEDPKIIRYYFYCKKDSKINLLKIKKTNIQKNLSIAIQIHVFYPDLLNELYFHLKYINISFDLFLTTDSLHKKKEIELFFNKNPLKKSQIQIDIVENRGRDIWPFLQQTHYIANNYEFIIHLHTKKSLHSNIGNSWRKYLYKNILGKNNYFTALISTIHNDETIGFISPAPYMKVLKSYYDNLKNPLYNDMINSLLQKLNITNTCSSLYEKKFPSGNMFIARTNAIRQLLDYPFTSDDFPEELGQLNGTLQHIIEFIWFYIVNFNNYTYKYCKYKKTF